MCRQGHHGGGTSGLRFDLSRMSAAGVRRGKAAFFSGCKSHLATIAPAGSNRSSHGGNEVAEASGIVCHKLASLHFRCGSTTEVQRGPRNVAFWGHSGSRFRATRCLLVANTGLCRVCGFSNQAALRASWSAGNAVVKPIRSASARSRWSSAKISASRRPRPQAASARPRAMNKSHQGSGSGRV